MDIKIKLFNELGTFENKMEKKKKKQTLLGRLRWRYRL
jgi:hypothetical protein